MTSTPTCRLRRRSPISASPSASVRVDAVTFRGDRTGGDVRGPGAYLVAYQTSVGLRAIKQNQDADLVMIYIEQPDGSGHQFTLTDSRQPSDFLDNCSVGTPGNPPGAIGQAPPALRPSMATRVRLSASQRRGAGNHQGKRD